MKFRMFTDHCFHAASRRRGSRGARGAVVQAVAGMAALLSAAWPITGRPADGVVSADQIEQALAPPPRTRGLVVRPKAAVDNPQQAINLNIPFEFDSSALQQQATAQLKQLRAALTSPALSQDQFMVAGHTDAKGSAQHNQQLSIRRAQAVKRFLVDNGVPAARLQAVGYGSEHLAVPDRPEDPANRRVEIRNLGEKP